MEKMMNIPERSNKKRVVIIGAGFGGLKMVNHLNPDLFDIVLLDKNNYHQFQPLLYQVAIAGLEPSSISYPLRKSIRCKQNIHFKMCEATNILPESNTVETNIGSIEYDYLVIATGCDTNFFGNQTLKDTAIPLKSVSEALYARNRILQNFEDAASTNDPAELEKLLNFVIVGGGATGVELAGALADMRNFVLPKDYPEIDFSHMQIHLIDASPRLLQSMSEHASKESAETLQKRGVIIHQKVFVNTYENEMVTASDGTKIYSRNVLWVAGIVGNRINGLAAESFARGNRLTVDEYCYVKGYKNILAIGDIAYMLTEDYPLGHPQVAQVAIQKSKYCAGILNRQYKNKKSPEPFRYKDKGSLATIGRNAAVADLGSLKFGGRAAWWLWLWVHIYTIVGVKNKVLVILNWAWNYVTYDVSLRILIRPKINNGK